MGIFSNKQDETQSTQPNDGIAKADDASTLLASLSTPTVNPTDSVITPDAQTAPPLDTSPDDNGGYLTSSEPVMPAVTANDSTAASASSTVAPVSVTDTATVMPADKVAEVVSTTTPVANDDTLNDLSTSDIPVAEVTQSPLSATSIPVVDTSATDTAAGDLADIKKQAIEKLSPLIPLLDQTPEEKFHTTMMLLQSTDNKALIKDAYDIAQLITDEKTKAQALLDVVNEINYYTQTTAS